MKKLMLGNEAIARGAWESGAVFVSSYPGTPSTEITEYIAEYPEVHAEWAANEKVALEAAVGASLGGARSMSCMKHVGLNVAADPLYTVAYTGVNAGLVVVVADDPGMHSSQNEQDSRYHARASLTPMLEPADSAECLTFTKFAFELSEKYDTPVLIRLTTRIAHARSLVEPGTRADVPIRAYAKDIMKNVMMPGMARGRHVEAAARLSAIAIDSSGWDINKIEMRDAGLGIICSGVVYQYVREALPEASVLKLGIVNPLPHALIEHFASQAGELYIIEELEPIIHEQISSRGIACRGKLTGRQGELSASKIAAMFGKGKELNANSIAPLPARPPVMCPGCPHRGPFSVIKKLKLTAMGDIGCYTLGALPPLNALDTSLCMGASVGMAQGMGRAGKKVIAVIGDSTFVHSGITSLLSAAYNDNDLTVLILDNATTGMTGHQHNPATGYDIRNRPTFKLSLETMCEACGASGVRVLDAFDLDGLEKALREETERPGVSVIIARRPCALLKHRRKDQQFMEINAERCKRCMACMNLGCPSIEKNTGVIRINPLMCVGCGLCKKVCRFEAIRAGEKSE